ncbi:hypothetical protein HWQ46_26030 [Shewanella sp. D64]|uniref:hypothetical protein n=1 Tax=unclassified Shewanella TaxID=196818 RepID=UPI0022BA27F6|nr:MULTISPECIES: hypothetical protein [unclassified Shewanella]MEC4728975.1 hypothetical protein [Shewanella sp. D64]MEC4740819.1 hypothetical protein [Shewanella sp. E94]WBJ94785.1 hypothetical protein HWQ47_23510 [Shewanella sp. MTB7]
MKYNDVLAALDKNSDGSFSAVEYDHDSKYFSSYSVSVNKEEEDQQLIVVLFDGRALFSFCGDEEVFLNNDVPDSIHNLNFKPSSDYPDLFCDYTSEYVAYCLFPELPDPEKFTTTKEEVDFANRLNQLMNKVTS